MTDSERLDWLIEYVLPDWDAPVHLATYGGGKCHAVLLGPDSSEHETLAEGTDVRAVIDEAATKLFIVRLED